MGFPIGGIKSSQKRAAAPKWTIMEKPHMCAFVSATIAVRTLFRWLMNGILFWGGGIRIKTRLGSDGVRDGFVGDLLFFRCLFAQDKHSPFIRKTEQKETHLSPLLYKDQGFSHSTHSTTQTRSKFLLFFISVILDRLEAQIYVTKRVTCLPKYFYRLKKRLIFPFGPHT